ncbi:S41 family peptidase [Sphingobacterium sp. HMA12]|uniref:S41 family peptidase n=1 Tax=Sphingobacterium sp. HMA12 TaxID=2050894 RepID=UPI000CEA458D|nr:S41 family peptidase [Sphingobacterium sp. HMA12]
MNFDALLDRKIRFMNFLFLLLLFLIVSCKKKDESIVDTSQISSDKVLDSIYLYAKDVYLWNEYLPECRVFNPQKYYRRENNALENYLDEIQGIGKYAVDSITGFHYENKVPNSARAKYSTIINVNEDSGNGDTDFGISVARTKLGRFYIAWVDHNSPAGESEIKRGDRVLSINNRLLDSTMGSLRYLQEMLQSQFVTMEIETDGKNRLARLGAKPYRQNPVLKAKIIEKGNDKTGYLALKSFAHLKNSQIILDAVFSDFAQVGINELILDLRYNLGGYQNTCVYLANNVAGSALAGKLMFSEIYNRKMQEGEAEILKKQPILTETNQPVIIDGKIATLFDLNYKVENNRYYFKKIGALNGIKKITFIVSNATASASELLINILAPYLDVEVLGVAGSISDFPVVTYGKPVGFFDINIDHYKLYLAMYRMENALGNGNYYDGFSTKKSFLDNVSLDFGNERDDVIAYILGLLPKSLAKNKSHKPSVEIENSLIENERGDETLKGLVKSFDNVKLKK